MPYLIDGHNLIPKLGLRLDALDDEMALVERLQPFLRIERKQADVYFDGAPPGQPDHRRIGRVTAHFVRRGLSADEAIRGHLARLGRTAPNWIVVSSDRQVQTEARTTRAQVLSSEMFARKLVNVLRAQQLPHESEGNLSEQDVEEWLKLFGQGRDRSD